MDQQIRCLWCGEPTVNIFDNWPCMDGHPCFKCRAEQNAEYNNQFIKWLKWEGQKKPIES